MSNSLADKSWTPPTSGELAPLSGEELSRWELAPGDIFLRTRAGKVIRLKRAGDVLEPAWRQRFRTSPALLWKSLVQTQRVAELVELFRQWESTADPVDAEVAREKFFASVRDGLRPEGGLTLIDWAFTCHTLFKPHPQLVEEFQNKHVVLYRRGLLVSALAVLLTMACGYHDTSFLQDVYQTGWWLDAGLLHEDFSYWVTLACQAERLQPGAGDLLLREQQVSERERELFLEHPRKGFDRATIEILATYTYPELLVSVLRHHEKSDGTGFPSGMPLSVMSDWETLMMLADNMVDYREEVLEVHLGNNLGVMWSHFLARPIPGLPVDRVVVKLKRWLRKPRPEVSAA